MTFMDYLSNFFLLTFTLLFSNYYYFVSISVVFFSNKLNSCIKNIYFNLYRVYIYK